MIFGSVCSGIEAASVAWGPLGWRPRFLAEIDPFCCALLKHYYPNVRNYGDFTQIGESESIGLLVGGTPCQDFSVAGLRAGLDGARGQLTIEFTNLAERLRTPWLVWENVPGVLSADGGRAFGIFLGRLAKLGYGFAYRVLDAQHFGVPQRRRRVFVVGYLGDWRRAAAVLFERACLSGNPAPSRATREDVAECLRSDAAGGKSHGKLNGTDRMTFVPDTAWALQERDGKGPDSDTKEGHLIVTHSLRADGFDASEDGTGRGTPLVAGTLRSNYQRDQGQTDGNPPCVVFDYKQSGEVNPTMRSLSHDKSHANGSHLAVATFDERNITSKGNRSRAEAGEPCHSLHADAPRIIGTGVRRLTPRECERLQGFPDDYTLIPYRGKPASDGPRYRALGNSMAVPVMRWIGQRIEMVNDADKAGK